MAESKILVSSSSSEQVRLVHLKLHTLTDENIKTQVQQTHSSTGYSVLVRQSLFVSISHILKPATHFVDSILLDKKVTEKGVELESSNLLKFNSALSELRELGETFTYFDIISCLMGKAADKAEEMFNENNVDQASIHILQFLSDYSWDGKAVLTMANFVLKFVELLALLLHGPKQSSIELASSMAALKENHVSIVGTPLEKFQQPLDQLNSLIKITLELIQYICDLTLLMDTEYSREDIVSMGVHWAILSTVAGYIQITMIVDNGEVALELSHLISNLSQILNDLKHHYTICKPQIEEMEAHIQSNALFDDIFDTRKESSDAPTDISELMKRLTYSKDGHQSLIDGSTKSKVDIEVLKEKTVLLLISDLDIPTKEIKSLLEIYEKIREEDYYKIVWIPFVLKWTEELRHKFENLKSKMPWYTVCYDLPIAGLWYFKGRWTSEQPSVVLINPLGGMEEPPASIAEISIYTHFSSKRIWFDRFCGAAPPILPALYINESAEGRTERSQKAGVQLSNPSSGFQGLLFKNKKGNEKGGSSRKI